ncbi:hypothetical protein [Rothia nasimurium]|uniref:hypothetical protein n=1 Tax=Rothia nasimurium TaxID=85336 RepID=UPI001F1B7611|nr:hypothetical protein [Rothia nasimurium]
MADIKHIREVPLPEGLNSLQIYSTINETEKFFRELKESSGIILSNYIQANNFSGIISNIFSRMLDSNSHFKQYKDDRYPDNKNYKNGIGLEVKATKTLFKGGEGHNGHSGWHIIVCYMINDSGDPEILQVETADLIGYGEKNSDWRYQGSKRNENNSQRTETYTTTPLGTAKLRDGMVYFNKEKVKVTSQMANSRKKLQDRLPIPEYSIFFGL